MKKFFNRLIESSISPNQLYLLYCIRHKIEPSMINIHAELRGLKLLGFVDKHLVVSQKGELVLQECESMMKSKPDKKKVIVDVSFIDSYLELWPSMKLPSGKYAKSDRKNILTNFTWFFSNYEYDMETVLKATALYIDEYAAQNYKYMRTSQYFIRKSDSDKTTSSELANYCDMIERDDIPTTDNPFEDKVV